MTFRTKFLLFVSICVPPNNPMTACGVTSFPGYHSFPKWAILVNQTMCTGAAWFNAIIMFLLLLVCLGTLHCFGFVWGGRVALTRLGVCRVCPHLCWEKVRTSSRGLLPPAQNVPNMATIKQGESFS